jgi:phosphoribosylformylglycinamidine synthase
LSTLEIWCNESQERVAFLIWPDRYDLIEEICAREGCPCAIVGQVTNDGYLILHDENDGSEPVNLPLDKVLGELPQKTFHSERISPQLKPLELPKDLTVLEALDRVLRLVSVGSKRFLTTKVDRSVTGLIAQQQCVGPNQLTLSDYAVVAHSHFGLTGTASSLGEQPIKGLISPGAMARLSVAEALLNIVGAKVTKLEDIKYSGNWMLAAKEPGEGAWLYDAACAVRDISLALGTAPDGGKDSLSMAAKVKGPDGQTHIVKAPGELVIANYVTMDNITCKVTPDLKKPGNTLLFIDLAKGINRLGGSALAQVFKQIGDDCPDVDDTQLLRDAFNAVQELVSRNMVCSVHDRSDGGLITTLLEMAFAGNVGLDISLQSKSSVIETLFSEELGLVLEVEEPGRVVDYLQSHDIPVQRLGIASRYGGNIAINVNGQDVLNEAMVDLRIMWEQTSTQLDRLQANPESVEEEAKNNYQLITPSPFHLAYKIEPEPDIYRDRQGVPKVAILRERGTNGDREMASAFFLAGFEVWDITMTDLLAERISLDDFRGLIFPGGFSFADVMDASKGWSGVIRFNERLAEQFERFYCRPDTFSFGVCNGCQLMALLGWVPWRDIAPEQQPRFIRNYSGRFESRFSTLSVELSPAIMLQGMEGSVLGVWVAHGEGRMFFPNEDMVQEITQKELAPLRFVDRGVMPTMDYPFNPNGSTHGITSLCSQDGRHLAMMPHPERLFKLWQWPWMPPEWRGLPASPWLKLFQNAYEWCTKS